MALRFHKQALADLKAAREEIRPGHYYVVTFLAEQAAEKAVKAAYWHLLAEQPPSTHHMAEGSGEEHGARTLTGGIAERIGGIPDEVVVAISQLQASLEVTRYPSNDANEPVPAELIDEADAIEAVAFAETVMIWAESLLQLPIGRPKRRKS